MKAVNSVLVCGSEDKVIRFSTQLKYYFPDWQVLLFNSQDQVDVCIFLDHVTDIEHKLKSCKLSVVACSESDMSKFKGASTLVLSANEYSDQVSSTLYSNVEQFFENVIVLGDKCILLKNTNSFINYVSSSKNTYITTTEKFESNLFMETHLTPFTFFFSVFMFETKDVRFAIEKSKYYSKKVDFVLK